MKKVEKKVSEITIQNAYAQNLKHLFCNEDSILLMPIMGFWTNFGIDIFWEKHNFASGLACILTAIFKILIWSLCYLINILIYIFITPFIIIFYIAYTPISLIKFKRKYKNSKETIKVWSFK